jgi:Insect cuticle protein
LSTKQESKSHDGSVHGGYSYVDAHGHVQSVKYVADPHHGFQIVAATNLPKGPAPVHAVSPYHYAPAVHGAPLPVQKTHEVLAAEHEHFAAVAEAKARVHHHYKRSIYEYAPAPVNGVPVDTAEVQHAKAKHFAAVHQALASAPAHYDAPAYYDAPAHYAPSHYAAPVKAYNHYAYQPAPAPVNGVPVDTVEVKHAIAAHFAAVADAKSKVGYSGHYASAPAYHHAPAYYAPAYNGAPEETYEVKAEKAKHFAAVAEAQSKSSYSPSYNGKEDDGSYDARRYETENYH